MTEEQDPLPENKWLFRRLYAYVVSAWLLILTTLGLIWLRRLESADNLLSLAIAIVVLLGLVITYYMIAPSAEHITRIFQTVSALKGGVATSVVSTVTTAAGKVTETTSKTGKTAAPAEPPKETPWQ